MATDRVTAHDRVHHIHVAGRGSTPRKVVLAAFARLLGCVHVLHLHDYDYATDLARRPAWQRALIARMFRGAAFVLVLGSGDRAVVRDRLGVADTRVIVLANAVPDPRPRSPADAGATTAERGEPSARADGGPPRIVFLGRLCERKGVPELLEALSGPWMRPLSWRAVLAGDGPVEAFRREAERLGIADRVSMPGWIDETRARALCAEADILVSASHHEGLAMAVLEGLAHGLAVVATPVGAHPETVADAVVMVPPGDPGALGVALARLVAEPAERQRLGSRARALFLERFDIDRYMSRLARIHDAARAAS
jgi:glycosyltransferase involved in cell wall biosynthesis